MAALRRLEAEEQEDYETRLIEATGFTRETAPKANENDPAWVACDQFASKLVDEPGQWDEDDWECLTETLYPLVDEIRRTAPRRLLGYGCRSRR